MTKKTPALRFESLDALRGIAALFIAFVHFPAIFLGADFGPLRHAYVLTNLFFGLSGFIIMSAYGERMTSWAACRDFSKQRLYRLIPLHAVTALAILAVPYVAYGSNLVLTWMLTGNYAGDMPAFPNNWEHYMVHVLMLQGFGLIDQLVYNFPAWSMGAIFFCSILLALILTIAPRLRAWWFAAIALGAWAVIALKSPNYMGATHDYGIFRALTSYFLGALTLLAWKRWRLKDGQERWALVWQSASVVVMFWFATWVGVNSPRSLLAPVVFALFIWSFAHDNGDFARFLEHPLFKWLSTRSYSLFMNQALFLFIGLQAEEWIRNLQLNAWDGRVWGTVAGALYLGLLLVVSDWTYKHIEQRFAPRKKPRAAVKAPSATQEPAAAKA